MTYLSKIGNKKELFLSLFQAFSTKYIFEEDCNLDKIKEFASKFSLTSRIGGILSENKDLKGKKILNYFYPFYKKTLEKNLIQLSSCGRISVLAKRFGTEIVFLKGIHLLLCKHTKLGYRDIADIDILLPEKDAKGFYKFLLDNDFKSLIKEGSSYHLPVITDGISAFEIHRNVPFLILKDEKKFLDFSQLKERAGIEEIDNLEEKYLVLKKEYFFSHLITHCLFQHFYSPHLYPFMRFFLDFYDLNLEPQEIKSFLDFFYKDFIFLVRREKILASVELLDFFKKGNPQEINHLSNEAKSIFEHLVKGALDKNYYFLLRLNAIKNSYHFQKGFKKLFLIFRDIVMVPNYKIEMRYRKPKNKFHLILIKIYHIFNIFFKIIKFLFYRIIYAKCSNS